MFRKLYKSSKNVTGKIIIYSIIGIILILLAFIFLRNQEDIRSERNLKIIQRAMDKNDESICDQIRGGIKEQTPGELSWGEVVARSIPSRNEEEAKTDCISGVQHAHTLHSTN